MLNNRTAMNHTQLNNSPYKNSNRALCAMYNLKIKPKNLLIRCSFIIIKKVTIKQMNDYKLLKDNSISRSTRMKYTRNKYVQIQRI